MRILFWLPHYWPDQGGIETLAACLVPALQERGHEIMIVAGHGRFDTPDRAEVDGVPVHRFRVRHALVERDFQEIAAIRRGVARLIEEVRPEVVHFHWPNDAALMLLPALRSHPIPTLVTVHGPMEKFKPGPETLVGSLLRAASFVTAVSEDALNHARRVEPAIADRSALVHNGIPMNETTPAPLRLDPPVILVLGRLVPQKGIDLAVAALPSILKRIPSAQLVVAGAGPEQHHLETQAKRIGVSNSVRLLGSVPHESVPDLLSSASVVLMPSRTEGLPMVALEAGQMSRPVVATRVGGLPEVIIHNQTGKLVPPDDPEAIAEAVVATIDAAGEAASMGREARRRVNELFGIEPCAASYDVLYRRLAAL